MMAPFHRAFIQAKATGYGTLALIGGDAFLFPQATSFACAEGASKLSVQGRVLALGLRPLFVWGRAGGGDCPAALGGGVPPGPEADQEGPRTCQYTGQLC
jgi:hypothetical protein